MKVASLILVATLVLAGDAASDKTGKPAAAPPQEDRALQQLMDTGDLERLRPLPRYWRLQMYNADQVKLLLLLLRKLPSMKPLPLDNAGTVRVLSRSKREADVAGLIRQDLRTEGGRCAWALERMLECNLPIFWKDLDREGQAAAILESHCRVLEHMRLPEVSLKNDLPELAVIQRESLAASPLSNIHLLQALSYDGELKVRLAVASNVRTAAPTLARLRDNDPSAQVRDAARLTISRLSSD